MFSDLCSQLRIPGPRHIQRGILSRTFETPLLLTTAWKSSTRCCVVLLVGWGRDVTVGPVRGGVVSVCLSSIFPFFWFLTLSRFFVP